MSEPKLMLNNITINKNKCKLDVVVVYPNSLPTPKVRVLFTRGEDIRRLPLLVRGTFSKDNNEVVSICSYTYLLDYIFTDKENSEDFFISFEMSFGELCFENTGYFVSDADTKLIDTKYLADERFDGASVFSNDSVEEESENENVYSYILEPKKKRIRIQTDTRGTEKNKCGIIKTIFEKLTTFMILGCAVLLLPYFAFDAFLATVGLVPRRKQPPVEGFVGVFIAQFKANIANFLKCEIKNYEKAVRLISLNDRYYERYYKKLCKKPIIENRISFISGRRDELGGNEKFVYDLIKDRKDIDFQFLLSRELDRFSKNKDKKRFYQLYATSKVVIVDDYYNLLNTVEKREEVKLFQLWHACGAFKTFGFSRLGKSGSPKQTSPSHRMYDYTIVSSEDIVKFYAEGFGISDYKVLPIGIPRTDIFFDEEYAKNVKNEFYSKRPELKDKKIILFAPTFRGDGQKSAFYPLSAFNPEQFIDELGEDYAVIIKLHPFCTERYEISEKYKNNIIDLSDEDELNDLLFVTDLLVTDYSSCIFEASLLDIPMLFLAYDLYQYISERDFYCEFETFVPGKIVFTQEQLTDAIEEKDFESDKIPAFKHKFFADTDGKSSQRVADAIMKAFES